VKGGKDNLECHGLRIPHARNDARSADVTEFPKLEDRKIGVGGQGTVLQRGNKFDESEKAEAFSQILGAGGVAEGLGAMGVELVGFSELRQSFPKGIRF